MSAAAHAAAVKALIGSTVRLYDGAVPDGATLPYAVLYIDSGAAQRGRMTPVSDRHEVTFQITSVGSDPTGARSVADRVRGAVLDKRPAATGRTCTPVWQTLSQPLRVDRDVTPHLLFVTDEYAFTSTPA